ncbi:MAG: hypothetical protein C0620_03020 [Desulfuromonas sp.]|nr:MAG: hypothetical protein C0620_03020 [Desulfuromonas sp.]
MMRAYRHHIFTGREQFCRLRHLTCVAIAIVCLWCPALLAKVTGPCSNCHTMHNSQNNSLVNSSGPNHSLLLDDCVGCHTGTNTQGGTTPFVHNTGTVDYNTSGIEGDTLAGGTFKYVAATDYKGHNVEGIANTDLTLSAPPGFDGGRAASDGSTPGNGSWSGQQITCAGTYGCHGTHSTSDPYQAIYGGHHKNSQGTAITAPDDEPASGYRLLVGIAGYEDPEWEFTPTAALHNQYKGIDDAGQMTETSTISSFCAQCHGLFHNPSANLTSGGGSPWLRHPTDYDMGNTDLNAEYRNYGGAGHAYLPATPVASSTVTSVKSSVTFSDDTIVTCLSCHRAHGSDYYKAMRWGYAESNDGGLCSNCHTTKD